MPAAPDPAFNVASVSAAAATAQTTQIGHAGASEAYIARLTISSAAAAAGDTLDVTLQTSFDNADTWVNVVAFTQVLGNGGELTHLGKVVNSGSQAMFLSSAALAAGSIRNIMGPLLRVSYVIAGATPVFSFSVSIHSM